MARIPKSRLDDLKKKVEDYNRRATKLGLNGFALETGQTVTVVVKDEMTMLTRFAYKAVVVTLTGEAPHFDGWSLAASIDRADDKNIVNVVPGREIPSEYRTRYVCDHCGTSRKRNATYVLVHDDGRLVQVGSTCIKDFLPTVDAEGLLSRHMSLLADFASAADPEESGCWGAADRLLSVSEYLSWVARVTSEYGWMSASRAREIDAVPTKDTAFSAWDIYLNPRIPDHKKITPPTDEHKTAATAAIEWVRSEMSGDTDFVHNLMTLLADDYFDPKHRGYVASAIACHRRHLEQQREKAEQAKSEWQGEIKKRQVFRGLTLVATRDLPSNYGVTVLHRFRDEAGNVFVWFASSRSGIKDGEAVDLRATVKDHDEFRGAKQTIITRCKVE